MNSFLRLFALSTVQKAKSKIGLSIDRITVTMYEKNHIRNRKWRIAYVFSTKNAVKSINSIFSKFFKYI